jgi:hypothetical protein
MSQSLVKPVSTSTDKFFALVRSRFKFSLFLLRNLPSAYFSGVRIVSASDLQCTVSVPYKWFSRNPFNSTYFACLSMAAEMSTGILAMSGVYKRSPKVSMLVVAAQSKFHRKATGLTHFICDEGWQVRRCIDEAVATGEPQTITLTSNGYNDKDELIAEFSFTWSFRQRASRENR